MSAQTSMLHIRVDDDIKDQATQALAAMGLSMSDAVRLFLRRVVVDQAFPLELKVPNAETLAAIEESRMMMSSEKQGLLTLTHCWQILKKQQPVNMRSASRHAESRLYLHPGPVLRDHRGNGCGAQRHLTTPRRAMSLHKPRGADSQPANG